MDSRKPCVRNRAAHERDIAHPRQQNVADVLAAPVQQPIILLAPKPRADCFFRQSFFPYRALLWQLCQQLLGDAHDILFAVLLAR
jgi:hypothetical protein